jgi:hypothetical protein
MSLPPTPGGTPMHSALYTLPTSRSLQSSMSQVYAPIAATDTEAASSNPNPLAAPPQQQFENGRLVSPTNSFYDLSNTNGIVTQGDHQFCPPTLASLPRSCRVCGDRTRSYLKCKSMSTSQVPQQSARTVHCAHRRTVVHTTQC